MVNVNGKYVAPEVYAQYRDTRPVVSGLVKQGVSSYRSGQITNEVQQGLFRENANANVIIPQQAGLAVGGGGMHKSAQILSSAPYGGGSNTGIQSPDIYSPLWLYSNLNLPRDRATVNAWCRAFFAMNGFIHNAISLHSTYPISKLNIKCNDPEKQKFFAEMSEEIDLLNICIAIAQEYWLVGEAFPYLELDQNKGKWRKIFLQNPDYMVIQRTINPNEPIIMMKPDQQMKTIAFSNNPKDLEQKKNLSPYILDAIKRGQNIPFDSFHISHIARKIAPFELRGTGLPVAAFKSLVLFDKLKENKFAQADNLINGIQVVKVGGDEGYKPTKEDLEYYRDLMTELQYNKDPKIVTHAGVTFENFNKGAGIYDTNNDFEQLRKEIFIAMQVPQVLMDGGADTSYANGGVALDALKQRYMSFRNMLANWLRKKVFAPIAQINDFYEVKGGEKQLIIPEIEWNHMQLFDTNEYVQNLLQLHQGEPNTRKVSYHALYQSLGLDFDDEVRKIKKENISIQIVKKEWNALEKMSLNELRAITDNDEVKEKESAGNDEENKDSSVPGEMDLNGTPPSPSGENPTGGEAPSIEGLSPLPK